MCVPCMHVTLHTYALSPSHFYVEFFYIRMCERGDYMLPWLQMSELIRCMGIAFVSIRMCIGHDIVIHTYT